MTLARLLLAAALLSSLPAFTQDEATGPTQLSNDVIPSFATNTAATPAPTEPWKVIPNSPSNSADHIRIDQFRLDHSPRTARSQVMDSNRLLNTDATCFTMRSYVVARDSKDSDSVHSTGYSTCPPASKYGVKTTQEESIVQDR